ncbi:hypothetical protein VUR80DRAFT_6744 [Thermomyces stellatus]
MRRDGHLLPCVSISITNPVVPEDLVPALHREEITPVQASGDCAGAKEVELADGLVLNVDAVIFCTGYTLDFGIFPELEMNGPCGLPIPTVAEAFEEQTKGKDQKGGMDQKPKIPRLFQMILPPRRAPSIAMLSCIVPQESRRGVYELAWMAIAGI